MKTDETKPPPEVHEVLEAFTAMLGIALKSYRREASEQKAIADAYKVIIDSALTEIQEVTGLENACLHTHIEHLRTVQAQNKQTDKPRP